MLKINKHAAWLFQRELIKIAQDNITFFLFHLLGIFYFKHYFTNKRIYKKKKSK